MPEDKAAVELLYEAHAPGLLAFLYARLMDRAGAEDILHDVFLAYLRQDHGAIASPKGYLYRAAHHASLTALRNRATADRVREQLAASTWRQRQGADPAQAEALREALDTLANDQREVLVLRVHGRMTFQEIANTLDRPLTTIFTIYQRAIETMRKVLDPAPAALRGLRP